MNIYNDSVQELERKEQQEYQDCILNIRAVLVTKTGKEFIKYLFKNLEVGDLPEFGMKDQILFEKLGFLRAGKSIYDLIAAADVDSAASILAQVTKEKHV